MGTMKVLVFGFCILFASEAWVSGHAGFSYLDPDFRYSFSESSRKILRSEDYESYWDNKKRGFHSFLAFSFSRFKSVIDEVKAAGVPIVSFDLSIPNDEKGCETPEAIVKASQTKHISIHFSGDMGDTNITLNVSRALEQSQAEILIKKLNALKYENIQNDLQAANTSEVRSVPVPQDEIVEGLILALYYPKFSIALSTPLWVRAQSLNVLKAQMQKQFDEVEKRLASGIEMLFKKRLVWLDEKSLVSLESKLGKEFKSKTESNFARSLFNPYGPLFDDFGRRSSASKGSMTIHILFVNKKEFNDSDPLAANRGAFEEWLRYTVRDPKEVEAEINHSFENAFQIDSEKKFVESEQNQASRYSIERFLNISQLYEFYGEKIDERLSVFALEPTQPKVVRNRALSMLRGAKSPICESLLLKILASRHFEGLLPELGQMATEYPSEKVILNFVALLSLENLSADDKSWVVYGLKSLQSKLKGLRDENDKSRNGISKSDLEKRLKRVEAALGL